MNCLIAIVGPTAAGKSRLAMEIARTFDGEIVNADSRHVYRYMDIGTNKPTRAERSAIPHHLLDLVNPDEDFSLGTYKRLAIDTINNTLGKSKLPVLAGGSGLYVWSVLENWDIPKVAPDPEFRRSMEIRARDEGVPAIYRELEQVDPEAALKIGPTNLRRLIRALELFRATGHKPSRMRQKAAPLFPFCLFGVTLERNKLYEAINSRVHDMIELGLVDEIKRLMEMGYKPSLPSMSAIGYRQIADYLKGTISLSSAIQEIQTETHRFARHQYAWFRLNDPRINWLQSATDIRTAKPIIGKFFAKHRIES